MNLRDNAVASEIGRAALTRLHDFIDPRSPLRPCVVCHLVLSACACMGQNIPYGTLGPPVKPDKDLCSKCYEPNYKWLGNIWAISHDNSNSFLFNCDCLCHKDEVWLA